MPICKLWYGIEPDLCLHISEGRCADCVPAAFWVFCCADGTAFFVNHHHSGNLRRCALPHGGFFFA